MSVETLPQLLKHELGDLLYAEKTIVKAMKKMSREIRDEALLERMRQHAVETEQQIENITQAFAAIGEKAKAEKCPGILGLITEHDEFKDEEEPTRPMLEAFDLGSSLRIEHYEIAAYSTSIAIAKAIGSTECARLLNENLAQEVAMEKFLRANAVKALKRLA